MPKFEDVRKLQKLVWEMAEQATGRKPLPPERATATRLISEAYDDPSPTRVATLKRWISAPFVETATAPFVPSRFSEGGILSGGSLVMEEALTMPARSQSSFATTEWPRLLQIGRQKLGRDLNTEEQSDLLEEWLRRQGAGVTEAQLAEMNNEEFRRAIDESPMASSPWSSNRQGRTPARVSESAVVHHEPTADLTAEMQRIARLPLAESREAWAATLETLGRDYFRARKV